MDNFKHLHLEELRELAKGDETFIHRMLESYCTAVPELLEKLRQAIAADDRETVRQAAHRLRPSFHYLGRSDVSAMLEEIEAGAATLSTDELNSKSEPVFREASFMLEEANEALRQTKG